MYNYRKTIISGLLIYFTLGLLLSCDFVFENDNKYSSNIQKNIKNQQIENNYWLLLANDNLHIIHMCNSFLNNSINTSKVELVENLLVNHKKIKQELTNVAEIKNISIPVYSINSLAKNDKQLLFDNKLLTKYFFEKTSKLISRQETTIYDIEKVANHENIQSSTLKIKKIIIENKTIINGLSNFENIYTTL